ncbi:MAG: hypothetical protein HC852_19725 [Acaryochloridaceae cyanobacterium RU_4_10]|nr:hypothetical protein [Acaryochloridaceae cyanobacterium RU_4_10]
MTRPFNIFGLLLTTGAIGVGTISMFAVPASAKTTYTYSSTLVNRYTSGCSEKLAARGKTPAQAQKLCQCSLTNMQNKYSQPQAIVFLTKAQFTSQKDPRTGLPSALTPYFVSCKA